MTPRFIVWQRANSGECDTLVQHIVQKWVLFFVALSQIREDTFLYG